MFEPALKLSEGEFKPLSRCSKAECDTLLLQLYEKMDKAMQLSNGIYAQQIQSLIDQVNERLTSFEIGLQADVKDKSERKVSILDDDF